MIRRPLRLLATALVSLVVVTGSAAAGGTAAHAETWTRISGSGSTWSQNALDQWRKNLATTKGMTVNYSGVGSSAGRRDFIGGTVDFAISEIPFQSDPEDGSAPEVPTKGFAYMPIVAGGTSFMYNLKIGGKRVTNLRLSGPVITGIFSGKILNWNDPAIKADNPGLAMPDKPIVPVVRSDGSGSTAQFTLWMSKMHPDIWGRTMTFQFPNLPNSKAQNGSLGVAGYVSQGYGEGAITYVEYSYALKSGFPVAKVLNSAGYYVEPTASSVAVGMMQATINSDLTQNLDGVYNNPDPRTYPLSSYSYMIVPTQVDAKFTEDKGRTLGGFADYVLCDGQQQAEQLGYSPLPMNLVRAASEQIKRIPGANPNGIDLNSCKNPTFQPGDSESSNRLALTAKQPAACDKQGPDQCTSGTAGAQDETPVTGGGSGGTAADAGGSAEAAAAVDTGAAAAATDTGATDEALYDSNGNLLSGAASGGSAVSAPFTVAETPWGAPAFLMLAAAILLLGAIVVPPVMSRRLRSSGARKG